MTAPGAPPWRPRHGAVVALAVTVTVTVTVAGIAACGTGVSGPSPTALAPLEQGGAATATADLGPALPSGTPVRATSPLTAPAAPRAVTIAFAGDIHTEGAAKVVSTTRLGEISELLRAADVAVVYLHWARELEVCPTERQLLLAQRLTEAGADIVAGSHAHVVQPVETVTAASGHSTTVAYGLGNFVWYHSREPGSITGVLTVSVAADDTRTTSWQPARIGVALPVIDGDPVPVPVTGCI